MCACLHAYKVILYDESPSVQQCGDLPPQSGPCLRPPEGRCHHVARESQTAGPRKISAGHWKLSICIEEQILSSVQLLCRRGFGTGPWFTSMRNHISKVKVLRMPLHVSGLASLLAASQVRMGLNNFNRNWGSLNRLTREIRKLCG